jgi:mannan endo-1,4-beta-mannosidase
MKVTSIILITITLFVLFLKSEIIADEPVTPNSSPEAKALLQFIYDISGKYMLTGQHNYPDTRDRNSQFAAGYIGETPAVWSSDFGFAGKGDKDSYLARPDIIEEAIRQHKLGSIITLCWHAVPPTADEPVTFQPRRGMPQKPDSLASVQGQLLDSQYVELLTPGTELYNRWAAQVDTVAFYLKKLQEAKVPVLWRPYHEMNGDWFWWGGRLGEYSTRAIYRMIFDRLVNFHELNNLIWVWSVDRPNKPEMNFSNYYPGNEYLDILSIDIYGNDYSKIYYDGLKTLSQGKPLALGEVGNPPAPDTLNTQPDWTWYVVWAGMVRNTSKKDYENLFGDDRVLSRDDSAYKKLLTPYRNVCGLMPLYIENDGFSGEWILNEEESVFDDWGGGSSANKMKLLLRGDTLTIERSYIVEYDDDIISMETMILDSSEMKSEFWNSPRVTTAILSEDKDTIFVTSVITFNRDGQTFEMKSTELWSLEEDGNALVIQQRSNSFRGERNIKMLYERE